MSQIEQAPTEAEVLKNAAQLFKKGKYVESIDALEVLQKIHF